MLTIALQGAPSAFNLQHWRPLLIEDRAQREKIREAAWGQAQVTDASMLVVLCGDLSSWESQVKRLGRGGRAGTAVHDPGRRSVLSR